MKNETNRDPRFLAVCSTACWVSFVVGLVGTNILILTLGDKSFNLWLRMCVALAALLAFSMALILNLVGSDEPPDPMLKGRSGRNIRVVSVFIFFSLPWLASPIMAHHHTLYMKLFLGMGLSVLFLLFEACLGHCNKIGDYLEACFLKCFPSKT